MAGANISIVPDERAFEKLKNYVALVPAISGTIGSGFFENGCWWIKFTIDIRHDLAWRVVQEFGQVLNYLSVKERLPTVFMPVSPPVYLNGGPDQFLSWAIESKDKEFKPGACAEWLEGRLPCPVNDLTQWILEE